MFDFDLGCKGLNFVRNTAPHNGEHWMCQVILKSLIACRSFAPNKRFSVTSMCDLDLWPGVLVHVRETASDSGEHFYEISLKFLHVCRRYALDKTFDDARPSTFCLPTRGKLWYDPFFKRAYQKVLYIIVKFGWNSTSRFCGVVRKIFVIDRQTIEKRSICPYYLSTKPKK
jgi:hypothetical protein